MPVAPLAETAHTKIWGQNAHKTKCVISAHGGSANRQFPLNASESVQFYVPAGQSIDLGIQNAGLFGIATGQNVNNIPPQVGNSPDYYLSKFEGYHMGASGSFGSLFETTFLKGPSNLPFYPGKQEWGTYSAIAGAVTAGTNPFNPNIPLAMDIVTIRFHPGKGDVSLEQVIRELRPFGYNEFHCPFCRG